MSETIFALSSGGLPSGVAVIRLSGPNVRFGFETICGLVPPVRQMRLCVFRDVSGDVIDRGLCVYFKAPHSFTGEDCAEFHMHGGRAVVRRCLDVLGSLPGFRMAEAGEFSKRAFLNGKMDLTTAEGLADLIAAETESQRRLALVLAEGGLRDLYTGYRKEIIRIRAMLEAAIEFAEEDDVADRAMPTIRDDIVRLSSALDAHIGQARLGEIIRDGYRVTILGAPNAGKSSLLNAIAGREVAIACEEAGTTRDVIEVRLDLGGNLVLLSDTAGLRETDGKIENIGIAKALGQAGQSNLILAVYDAHAPQGFAADLSGKAILTVGTHSDLMSESDGRSYDHLVSSVTGSGLSGLLDAIRYQAEAAVPSDMLAPVRDRQVGLLREAVGHARSALDHLESCPEVAAELLRLAGVAIGKLTGDVDTEELLDVIFGTFCIGK